MNSLDTGKDKIKKICEILKTETLEPAKEEAAKIIRSAEEKAQQLLKEAQMRADELMKEAQAKNRKDRESFEASLKQAISKGMEELKQSIENKLLSSQLQSWVVEQTIDPSVGARLITALVQAIEKEGIDADFTAVVAKTVSPREVNALLMKGILEKLEGKSVTVGEFMGGVQLRLSREKMTLDVSDDALSQLLKIYLHKDFRDLLFQ